MHDESPVPVRYYAEAFKRQAWLIALVTVLTLGLAVGALALQTKMYRASMILVLGSPGGLAVPEPEAAETMVALLTSEAVAASVIERRNLDTTPKKLLEDFGAAAGSSSAVIEASFEAPDPRQAERILGTFHAAFIDLLERRFESTAEITIFNPPRADPEAVSPNVTTTLAFAGVLGLTLGLLAAIVRERFDERIRSRQDAEEYFGAPVIGALPKGWRQWSAQGQGEEKADRALEQRFRMLSSDLQPVGGNGLVVIVTSMSTEDGKATIVANLGVTLAREGMNIVCVEADVQSPTLNSYLSADGAGRPGLVDFAQGKVDIESALTSVPFGGAVTVVRSAEANSNSNGSLRVMTMGRYQTEAATALTEKHVATLLDAMRSEADVIILDVSPLGRSEAVPFVMEADRVMLVARPGDTTRRMAADARAVLERLGARDVGVVLVDAGTAQLFS